MQSHRGPIGCFRMKLNEKETNKSGRRSVEGGEYLSDTVFVKQMFFLLPLLVFCRVEAKAPTTKLHYFRQLYVGEEKKTFSEQNPGQGIEFVLTTKEDHLNYFSKGRLIALQGSQKFDDEGAERTSDFTYYQSTFEVGAAVYPLPRKSKNLNVYLGFSGLVSYNYLALASKSFTKVKPSYQAMSFGYTGLMGFEWFLFGSSDLCLSVDFSQRYESASLAEQSRFGLGGFAMALGIAW